MRSILNESDRESICQRLQALTPSATRQWGRMTPEAMLEHLCLSMRMGLGELPVAAKGKRAFQVFPLKHLILYVVPFPKGAPTATELLPGQPASFEAQQALVELLQKLGAGLRSGAGPVHPLLGPLSRQEWGALSYKHADHHLRQFGV